MVSRRQQAGLLLLFIAANFTQLGARVAISPVIPQIIETFDTSKALVGLALTGMWAAYALVQYPSGVFGDRFGERAVILVGIALTALGSLLIALSPSYPLFLVFTICLGAGSGLYFTVATVLMTKRFDRIGQVLGIHSSGGPLAGLVAPIAAAYVGVRYGWRPAVLLGAAMAIPLFVFFFLRTSTNPPARPDVSVVTRLKSSRSLGFLLRPTLAFSTFLAAIGYFNWQSFSSFFPTFLIEYREITTESASIIFGMVFALAVVGLPALGRLSDRYNRDVVLVFGFLAGATGYAVFILMPTFWLPGVVVGTVLLGLGISWGAVMQARFIDALSQADRGTGFGLVRTIYMAISSLGSVVTGTLADAMGWPMAYGLVAGLLVFVALLLVINKIAGLEL